MPYYKDINRGTMEYLQNAFSPEELTAYYLVEVTKAEYDKWREEQHIKELSDKGRLADDIALLHISINELLSIYIQWLPIQELGTKQRFKIIQQTMIKYNLELVNKDYDPNFVVSARDKGVLITALTKIKEVFPEHYALLAKPFKLGAEATPDEIWTEYEKQLDIIHGKSTVPDLTGSGIASGI